MVFGSSFLPKKRIPAVVQVYGQIYEFGNLASEALHQTTRCCLQETLNLATKMRKARFESAFC